MVSAMVMARREESFLAVSIIIYIGKWVAVKVPLLIMFSKRPSDYNIKRPTG